MKYFEIFLLTFQNVLTHRSRSVVWFLISLLNPVLLLLFWKGSFSGSSNSINGWNLSYFTSYYFLLIIAGSLLMSHIEEDVAYEDIQQGHLSSYLVKPFSYYWLKFLEEIPYKIFQGSLGILAFFIFLIFLGDFIAFSHDPLILILTFFSICAAWFISFTFKMIVGLSAFWLTDANGLQSLVVIASILLAGYIMPIDFLPAWVKMLAYLTPFPYIIYLPIIIFQGTLSYFAVLKILLGQIIWIIILVFVYKKVWKDGINSFSAVGQ